MDERPPQQSSDFPDSFYRITVKGLIVENGKVLLAHDYVDPGEPLWEFPGGGLDFGEDIRDGLKREIEEEMGIKVAEIAETPTYVWTAKRENRRGLDWYWILLLAYRVKIESLDTFTPSEECREYKFFSKDELLSMPDLSEQMQPLAEVFNPADFS